MKYDSWLFHNASWNVGNHIGQAVKRAREVFEAKRKELENASGKSGSAALNPGLHLKTPGSGSARLGPDCFFLPWKVQGSDESRLRYCMRDRMIEVLDSELSFMKPLFSFVHVSFDSVSLLIDSSFRSCKPRLGRTNFQKCITATDPPVIQAFKQLSSLRPMPVISKSNPGEGIELNQAVIIRRGRNSFASVTKDFKDKIESAMNEFRTNLPKQADQRTAILVLAWAALSFDILNFKPLETLKLVYVWLSHWQSQNQTHDMTHYNYNYN